MSAKLYTKNHPNIKSTDNKGQYLNRLTLYVARDTHNTKCICFTLYRQGKAVKSVGSIKCHPLDNPIQKQVNEDEKLALKDWFVEFFNTNKRPSLSDWDKSIDI